MTTVSQFRLAISDQLRRRGFTPTNGRGKRGRSLHLISVPMSPTPTVLYVKESNTDRPGWWGLTRNHIDRLQSNGIQWFVVLLRRSASSGYLLSGSQVLRRIADGLFEIGRDGEYKVNEGSDLTAGQRFTSVEQLLERIL